MKHPLTPALSLFILLAISFGQNSLATEADHYSENNKAIAADLENAVPYLTEATNQFVDLTVSSLKLTSITTAHR